MEEESVRPKMRDNRKGKVFFTSSVPLQIDAIKIIGYYVTTSVFPRQSTHHWLLRHPLGKEEKILYTKRCKERDSLRVELTLDMR